MKIPGGKKIQLIKPKTPKEKGVLISQPCHRGMPMKDTWSCTKALIDETVKAGYRMSYNDTEGASICSNRITGVEEAQKAGSHWLLFIDDDMTFHPNSLLQLLEHDVDIVGGLCVKKRPPHGPTIYEPNKEKGGFNHVLHFELNELLECEGTGTGFLLIKMSVFDKLDTPYFAFVPQPNRDRPMGEDLYFCTKAREAGFKVHVDTGCIIGHLGLHAFTIFDFLAVQKRAEEEGVEDKPRVE